MEIQLYLLMPKKKFTQKHFIENLDLIELLTIKSRNISNKKGLVEAKRRRRQGLMCAIKLQTDNNVEEAFVILGEKYTPELENAVHKVKNGKNGTLYEKLQEEIITQFAEIYTTEMSLAIQVLLGISDSKYALLRKFLGKSFDWETKTYGKRTVNTMPIPFLLKPLAIIQQKRKEIENIIHRVHDEVGYVYNLEEYIKAILESPGLSDTHDLKENILRIKYSMDGTPLTKKKFIVVASFCILNQGRLINSTFHNYTHGIYVMTETTEDIHANMKSTMDLINKLMREGITIKVVENGKENMRHLSVEFFISSDYMFTRALLNFPKSFNDSPCIYCKVPHNKLGDFEDCYPTNDLEQYPQIIDCNKAKFVPDTLHMTMRLTSHIFEKTLEKIEISDTNNEALRSQLYSNMAKYKLNKEESCTTFLGRECWVLMRNIRQILEPFKLDEKIIHLWEVQRSLLSKISGFGKWYFEKISEFRAELTEWQTTYLTVFGHIVAAPYVHIFAIHIIEFLEKYGSLGKFSMQAIENKNKKLNKVTRNQTF